MIECIRQSRAPAPALAAGYGAESPGIETATPVMSLA